MKARIFAILTCIFLLPLTLHAWETLPGPSPEYRSILTSSDGERMVVALYQGGIWQSSDGGENWLPRNDILSVGTTGQIRSIDQLSAIDHDLDSLFVQVTFSPIRTYSHAITSDSGENWSWIDPIPTAGSSNHFLISDWTNPDHLLYLTGGEIANSWDFGQNWETYAFDRIPLAVGDFLQSPLIGNQFFVASDRFASFNNPGAFISDSDGHLWAQMLRSDTLTAFNNAYFKDMIVLRSGTFLLSAGELFNGLFPTELSPFNGLFRSEDGGYHWSIVEGGLPQRAYGFRMAQDPLSDRVYLWQETVYTTGVGLYQSLDDGLSFERVANGLPASMNHVSNVDVNEHTGTATLSSFSHGAWQTTDGGESWQPFDTGLDAGRLQRFTITENMILTSGWVDLVSSKYSFASEEWTALPVRSSTRDSIRHALPILIVDGEQTITFEVTSIRGDSTAEFQPLISTPASPEPLPLYDPLPAVTGFNFERPFSSVFQSDDLLRLAFSRKITSDEYTIDVSTDTGRTWVTTGNWPFYAKLCQTESAVFVLTLDGIFRSTTNGLVWEDLTFPEPDDLGQSMDFIEADPATGSVYVIVRNRAYRFNEDGWTELGTTPGSTYKFEVIPGDPTKMIRIIQNNDQLPYLSISRDEGATWSFFGMNRMPPLYGDQYKNLEDIQYDPWRDQIWISTPIGLMHADTDFFVAVEEEITELPLSPSLLSTWPNPFNGVAYIAFEIEKPGAVKLEVFDIQGRKMATLVDERKTPGRYRLSLDASHWPSGVYFTQLTSHGIKHVQKVTLIK